MATNYIVQFGATTWTGLSPTFTMFAVVPGGGSTTPPGVTEIPTASGLYYFTYTPLSSIAFILDAGVTALSTSRLITGSLDPSQTIYDSLGNTASSFGSTATDPSTVFGFLKRLMEFNEGDSLFTKTTGVWDIYARGNTVGASTQLTSKTLADNGSIVSKS